MNRIFAQLGQTNFQSEWLRIVSAELPSQRSDRIIRITARKSKAIILPLKKYAHEDQEEVIDSGEWLIVHTLPLIFLEGLCQIIEIKFSVRFLDS